MKIKVHYLLLCFLLTFTSISSGQGISKDSTDNLSSIKTKSFINYKDLRTEIESLKSELKVYKIQRDFFDTTIASQSKIFTAITTGFFILFGGLTFAGFRFELRRIEKKYENEIKTIKSTHQDYKDEIKDESEKFKKGSKALEKRLNAQMGWVSSIVSDKFKGKIGYFDKLLYGCYSHFLAGDISTVEKGLKLALTRLKKLIEKDDGEIKESLIKQEETLKKRLNKLQSSNDEAICDICSEIRFLVNQHIK